MTECVDVRPDFASSGASGLKMARFILNRTRRAGAWAATVRPLSERRYDRSLEDGRLWRYIDGLDHWPPEVLHR